MHLELNVAAMLDQQARPKKFSNDSESIIRGQSHSDITHYLKPAMLVNMVNVHDIYYVRENHSESLERRSFTGSDRFLTEHS